ncbi:hypothetical protein FDK38_000870 [Candidozyma auris]|nr:hypothetical protein FDK38_000870 [[Candida] auris]
MGVSGIKQRNAAQEFVNDASRTTDEEKNTMKVTEEDASDNESKSSISEGDSGIEDDLDVASSDKSESGDEEDDDERTDDEFPLKKKKKKVNGDGADSFASAFNAIIGSKLKAYDRNDPILARNKSTLKKMESDKLERKAKRELLAERKQLQDKVRIRNLLPSASEPEKVREVIEKEKKLKKVAQKGVVKLFNAVLATQVKTKEEISKAKVPSGKQDEMMNELSKSKFLDLVKAAGNT